jgi:hypothetical protein
VQLFDSNINVHFVGLSFVIFIMLESEIEVQDEDKIEENKPIRYCGN